MMLRTGVLLSLATIAAQPARAAEAVEDYFIQDWYATEVIIFQRPEVMEFNTTERLLITRPEPLPLSMRSFFSDAGQIGAGHLLDPVTAATLEPEFTTSEVPESFAVPEPDVEEELAALDTTTPLAPETEPQEPPSEPPGLPPPPINPKLAANDLLDFLTAVQAFESSLQAASYRWTPEADHILQRAAQAMSRRVAGRVLLHGRWLQPVPPRDAAQPLFVQAGPRFSDHHVLEGTLSITLGRYLHFRARLTYREPGFGQAPISLPYPMDPAAAEPTNLPAVRAGYMVLDESRRMRSEEVHYLDHPKLGIIVRVDPVAIPEALRLRLKALQERTE
jgi:hypothetical protein